MCVFSIENAPLEEQDLSWGQTCKKMQRKTLRNCGEGPSSKSSLLVGLGLGASVKGWAGAQGPTSGLGLAAALQHEADVVRAQDLLLEVAHELPQAGEAAVRAMQTVASLLHLDLKVLELFLATQHLPFRKMSRNDVLRVGHMYHGEGRRKLVKGVQELSVTSVTLLYLKLFKIKVYYKQGSKTIHV